MFLRGQVVKSCAGRDSDSLMVVVKSDEACVYVCDGKERRLSKPKRKNPKHVIITKRILNESQMHSDKRLRIALAQLESDKE